MLRHAEGRYERHEPDENAEIFEHFMKLTESADVGCPQESLVVVSAYDGIGGARRALEILGITPALYIAIERDSDCVKVVESRWPGVIPLQEVESVTVGALAKILDMYPSLTTGLLIGGPPCRGFSGLNRNRKEFDDPRL